MRTIWHFLYITEKKSFQNLSGNDLAEAKTQYKAKKTELKAKKKALKAKLKALREGKSVLLLTDEF